MKDNTVNVDTSQSPARLTFAPSFDVAVPFIDRHVDLSCFPAGRIVPFSQRASVASSTESLCAK